MSGHVLRHTQISSGNKAPHSPEILCKKPGYSLPQAVCAAPFSEWEKGFESSIVYIYEYSDDTEEFTLKQILRNLAEDV